MVAAACGDDGDSDTSAPAEDEEQTTTTQGPDGGGGGVGEGEGTPAPDPLPGEGGEVTVAYSATIEAFAPTLVADYFEEFENENLTVDLQQIGGPDGTVLLSQGEVDVQLIGLSAGLFNQVDSGSPLRFVAAQITADAPQAGHYIHKDFLDDNGDPDLEALEGARVAAGIGGGGFGNPGAYPVWEWANEAGFDFTEFEAVDVPSPGDAAQAIINGNVAIAIGLTPAWQQIVDSDCCELLVEQTVAAPFMTTETWLDENPDVAQAFFRAIMRTNRTYLNDGYREDEEVIAALAEITGQEEDVLASLPPLSYPADLEPAFRDVVIPFQEFFQDTEALNYDELIEPDEVIDTSPVDAILGG